MELAFSDCLAQWWSTTMWPKWKGTRLRIWGLQVRVLSQSKLEIAGSSPVTVETFFIFTNVLNFISLPIILNLKLSTGKRSYNWLLFLKNILSIEATKCSIAIVYNSKVNCFMKIKHHLNPSRVELGTFCV